MALSLLLPLELSLAVLARFWKILNNLFTDLDDVYGDDGLRDKCEGVGRSNDHRLAVA